VRGLEASLRMLDLARLMGTLWGRDVDNERYLILSTG
jgi:hypothetical protein